MHKLYIYLFVSFASISFFNSATAAQYFPDYLPFSNKWSYHKAPLSSVAAGQWATWNSGPNSMIITWTSSSSTSSFDWNNPVSIEDFEIRTNCSDLQSYIFLNGYRNNNNSDEIYYIQSTTTLLTVGGTTYDLSHITEQGNCAQFNSSLSGGQGEYYGILYAPLTFYDQIYTVEVWGNIYDAAGYQSKTFYWKAEYDPEELIENDCWAGAGSSTRSAIIQKEAYWDSVGGWAIGAGDPFTGEGVEYGRYQTYGENAGPAWTTGTISNGLMSSTVTCIPNVWSYQ